MELNPGIWDEWRKIWPCEYRDKFHVNFDGRFYANKSHRYNIFYNTKWKEVILEIRGNSLFAYSGNEQDVGAEGEPVMAWLLEHVNLNLGIPTQLLTLPSNLNLRSLDDASIIYIHEKDDIDLAFLAIFCQSKEIANDLLERLKGCSLTFLKSSVGRSFYNIHPASLALQEKAEISTNIALNRLESLKYEHDYLKKQGEALKLDNTLLVTQSTVNSQLYSEGIQLQLQENSHLKNELELAMKEITLRDDAIKKLEREVAGFRRTIADNQQSNMQLRQELESTNSSLDEANLVSEKKLRVMYTRKAKQVSLLSLQLLSSRFDNSKIASKFHSLKGEMKNELERIHGLVECEDIYELLKLWILCNELKVEYYENLADLSFSERNKLLERIERVQLQLNVAMTLARASYVAYRTLIFDDLLRSLVDDTRSTFSASKRVLNSAFGKLAWIFHPESDVSNSPDPLWARGTATCRLVEKTIYSTAPVWYNRVSFSSAVRPVVVYEQEDRDQAEIRKRLFYSLQQNSHLRHKIAAMSRLIGTDAHWRSIWRRTNGLRK